MTAPSKLVLHDLSLPLSLLRLFEIAPGLASPSLDCCPRLTTTEISAFVEMHPTVETARELSPRFKLVERALSLDDFRRKLTERAVAFSSVCEMLSGKNT